VYETQIYVSQKAQIIRILLFKRIDSEAHAYCQNTIW